MEARLFGERGFWAGGRVPPKLLPLEVLSTPCFASGSRVSMGERLGSILATHALLFSKPHSKAGGQVRGPQARTGSPKVKCTEQGVTQNEEMRQVGVRLPEVWSRHPRATRSRRTRGWGTESPTPAP